MQEPTLSCPKCDGSTTMRCERCKGLGMDNRNPPGECRACYGKGLITCDVCKGVGRVANPKYA